MDIQNYLNKIIAEMEASSCHFGHGYNSAHDEAVQLIAYVLGRDELTEGDLQTSLSSEQLRRLDSLLLKRTQEKIPLAYLIHYAYFDGLKLYVDERVHIPRSPIAELIEEGFSPWIKLDNQCKILDMCTGSGAIALACAHHLKAAVTGVDLSNDALAVAKRNQQDLALEGINWVKSNLYENIDAQFDVIVVNPPYLSMKSYHALPQEYHYEPSMSFVTGSEGLQLTVDLLKQSEQYLHEEGILVVEVGESEALLEKHFPNLPCTWLAFERGGGGVFMMNKDELRGL